MTKYLLTLLLSTAVVISSTAHADGDMKSVIAEMEKVQAEKSQILAALQDAKSNRTVSAAISLTSAAVMGTSFAWAVIDGFGSFGIDLIATAMNSKIRVKPSPFIRVITNKAYYITLATVTAGSGAAAVYFNIEAKNYQTAINALELDLQRLTKEISALQQASGG